MATLLGLRWSCGHSEADACWLRAPRAPSSGQELSLGAFPATPLTGVSGHHWETVRSRSLPHTPSTALLCRG